MGSNMPDPPSSTQIPMEDRPPMFAPPMFTPHESQPAEAVDLDLAFRICAIRETFEEIGILLGEYVHVCFLVAVNDLSVIRLLFLFYNFHLYLF